MAEGVAGTAIDLEAYPAELVARRKHCRKTCSLGRSVMAR
jgi:hypothetical protein